MITGHGDVGLAVRTMKLGATDFLEKPFPDDALLEVLEPLFGSLPAQAEAEKRRERARLAIAKLSAREREVLQCAVDGLQNKRAAQMLNISFRTVEIHRGNLMRTLGVSSIGEAIRIAVSAGMHPDSSP
jgi:two-component system response regulator FixJ